MKTQKVKELAERLLKAAGDRSMVDVKAMEVSEGLVEFMILSGLDNFNTPDDIFKKRQEIFTVVQEKLFELPESILIEFFSENEIRELVEIYENPLVRRFLEGYNARFYSELESATTSFAADYVAKFAEENELKHYLEHHADKGEKN